MSDQHHHRERTKLADGTSRQPRNSSKHAVVAYNLESVGQSSAAQAFRYSLFHGEGNRRPSNCIDLRKIGKISKRPSTAT